MTDKPVLLISFFRGAEQAVRDRDIHKTDPLDESQFIDRVKQASRPPGEKM